MLDSLADASLLDFGAVALGIRAINAEINSIDSEKAVAVSTVFDAATTTAAQTINTATMSSATAAEQRCRNKP